MKMTLITADQLNEKFFRGQESYQSIQSMARQKKIPSISIGKKRFFCLEIMNEFFEKKFNESLAIAIEEPVFETAGIRRID